MLVNLGNIVIDIGKDHDKDLLQCYQDLPTSITMLPRLTNIYYKVYQDLLQ